MIKRRAVPKGKPKEGGELIGVVAKGDAAEGLVGGARRRCGGYGVRERHHHLPPHISQSHLSLPYK